MKSILFLTAVVTAATGAGLVQTGVLPCPCEIASGLWAKESVSQAAEAPRGLYLEARDATVWGGACHISAEADNGGSNAVLGWSFESGISGGVELAGVKVIAALEGSSNLAAHEVFQSGEPAQRRSVIWIDAPSEEAATAALSFVQGLGALGSVDGYEPASLQVTRTGDDFLLAVPGVLEVTGEARADRSCCTMPESRWYLPLVPSTDSVVGVPATCRFDGKANGFASWTFEDENSAYVARFGA